jgi:lipopolysaccharide export LptBFGC system permease protein LptF
MKILDRYVIITFLKNYLISFFVLIGLYVTLDMVFNFDELVQVQERAGATSGLESAIAVIKAAGDYYFYQLFYIFVQLSGMIPVVAAAFTLIRLSRFNELSAMLAAGVPLLRIASPIIIVALILNGLLLLDQELLIPQIIPKLVRSKQEAGQETASKEFQIPAMQDDHNGVVNVARYRPGPGNPVMYEFTLVERNADLQPTAMVTAKRAEWEPETASWRLTEGQRIDGLLYDQNRKVQDNYAYYKSNVTPEEINLYRSGNYVELLSTHRIDELLDRPQSYGTVGLLRVKHARFTQPLVNIILLLLAIACVLSREPTRLKSAATWCLALTGLCMATTFIGQQLTGSPPSPQLAPQWPAIMAWLPILIFGPIAVFMLDRVET